MTPTTAATAAQVLIAYLGLAPRHTAEVRDLYSRPLG